MQRQNELDLAGKVAIITGASRGVGKQAALDMAKRGVKLVLAARTVDPDEVLPGTLGETLAEIEALGSEAIAVQTDLAREEDLKNLVDKAVERFGGVDILVNNAAATTGEMWTHGFMGLSREDWKYQFEVNLHAPYTLMQLCAPIMEKRGGGRIVNVTTGSGEVFRMEEEPTALEANGEFSLIVPGYFASKRALDRLGNVIAPELARKNIWVIGMHPGLVSTELVAIREEQAGLATEGAVPMEVPSRMIAYFAACEDPKEYTGRLFWAERELADMAIELD
jgi:NAD(P)-dependent dehydrogenase (short-subunit alcohol dehydrogenase family)